MGSQWIKMQVRKTDERNGRQQVEGVGLVRLPGDRPQDQAGNRAPVRMMARAKPTPAGRMLGGYDRVAIVMPRPPGPAEWKKMIDPSSASASMGFALPNEPSSSKGHKHQSEADHRLPAGAETTDDHRADRAAR